MDSNVDYVVVFRADQVELALDCFKYVQKMLNQGSLNTEAHKMAGRFVYRRLDELCDSVGSQVEFQRNFCAGEALAGSEK